MTRESSCAYVSLRVTRRVAVSASKPTVVTEASCPFTKKNAASNPTASLSWSRTLLSKAVALVLRWATFAMSIAMAQETSLVPESSRWSKRSHRGVFSSITSAIGLAFGENLLAGTRRPNLSYIGLVDMTRAAEQVLEQIRALTPAERLHVVERVIHEMASEVTPQPSAAATSIWADESDADFETFQSSVQQLRANDLWRASDAQDDTCIPRNR